MNDLSTILRDHIVNNPDFRLATFSGAGRAILDEAWNRVTIKPVMLKSGLVFQGNYYDNVKSVTRNHAQDDIAAELSVLAGSGFKSIYLRFENSGIQISITKKGAVQVRRHKALENKKPDLDHDRKKARPIPASADDAYLKVLGLSDASGRIKPSMQDKYRQISEFIRILDKLQDWNDWPRNMSIVDCGAGNAYLTFAIYHYFKNIRGKNAVVKGIDINPGSVENNNARAQELGWSQIGFEVSNISGFVPEVTPTLTLALHACDTATDEALMKGVAWKSDFIIAVPCCHHDLHKRLKKAAPDAHFAGVVKHGILRERLGDVLTDAFRALILEVMGYRTDVIQYVSTDHTARNVMIRATKASDRPLDGSVKNYLALKSFLQVTPVLEELLNDTPDFQSRLQQEN